MRYEEGERIDGEEELAPPDWRVRARPSNKPTQEKSMKQHTYRSEPGAHTTRQAEGAPITASPKKESEDKSRRPTTAMDYDFRKLKSIVNVKHFQKKQ